MSFTPQFLDQLRSRVSIAEMIGKRLDWDARKSNPARGDYWACCPFHGEKTPSFHVEDRKGFYYCFGCHEKGDVIGFLMKNDSLAFHEAVELLANEAGLPMPERDPSAERQARERKGLVEAMEAAQRFYSGQLTSAAAGDARAYLEQRGLTQEIIERFGIGFAPRGPRAVTDHLRDKGFSEERIVEAGLAGKRDDGSLYDRFRERIQFPIRDPRGQVIGFGGRSQDPNARAKYLNSPETPLFSKGHTLYNLGAARTATGNGHTLIVAEGYMDVIALVRGGFEAAVAPLGTALTEPQLGLIWRIADEPVIALDGDAAGLRAADRTARLALPLLQPGKTLRFALMPQGKDPDDILRESGRGALREVLANAAPLSEFLWRQEIEIGEIDTPERRADFDRRLRRLEGAIQDEGVRAHYRAFFRDKRRTLFAPAPRDSGRQGDFAGFGFAGKPRYDATQRDVRLETRSTTLASGAPGDHRTLLERRILQYAVNNCESATLCCDSLCELEFANHLLDSIRSALISAVLDFAERETILTVSSLQSEIRRKLAPRAVADFDALASAPSTAMKTEHLDLAIQRYSAFCDRDAERRDAEAQFDKDGDDRAFGRMMAARAAFLDELQRVMPPIPEEESVSVQPFIDQEMWKKPGRRTVSERSSPNEAPKAK